MRNTSLQVTGTLLKNNTVITSKQDTLHHGIGLANVDTVIRKNNGIHVLQCENGWFSFSAMIPTASL
ncbi:MAG: GHKL domain-containing protein [Lachnospiraceae bacterium]